jgi:16S rRNA (adenine1518-N6/adenine1519-N6)-dimethyltransferase
MYHARKSLGQHFLTDQNVIQHIVQALALKPGEAYVEIGPGLGALTQCVLPIVHEMTAIEFDKHIIPLLEAECAELGKLTIVQADILTVDFNALTAGRAVHVFGNLPYNISTPILFHLIKYLNVIKDMVFMLQEEVVERMAAHPNTKDYGRLTVMLQYYCDVQKIFSVPPEAFDPPPKVNSAVVRLVPKSNILDDDLDHNLFAHIVNVAFQQRRKTIRNSLKTVANLDVLKELGFDPMLRSENLSLNDYVALTRYLQKKDKG